jgi:hypothetical protein
MIGHIPRYAARSLIFPLPAPGPQDGCTPLPWDPAAPNKRLGFREVEAQREGSQYEIRELPVTRN